MSFSSNFPLLYSFLGRNEKSSKRDFDGDDWDDEFELELFGDIEGYDILKNFVDVFKTSKIITA